MLPSSSYDGLLAHHWDYYVVDPAAISHHKLDNKAVDCSDWTSVSCSAVHVVTQFEQE